MRNNDNNNIAVAMHESNATLKEKEQELGKSISDRRL